MCIRDRNMAAYLRKMAIDGYIIQIDHADIKAMTAEIQKIGVNVNQIARRVNATGNAYLSLIHIFAGWQSASVQVPRFLHQSKVRECWGRNTFFPPGSLSSFSTYKIPCRFSRLWYALNTLSLSECRTVSYPASCTDVYKRQGYGYDFCQHGY